MSSSFDALGVPADLVSTLKARGIDAPFAIQELTLADGLAGRDVSGRAPTGSGKTLAFGIPIVGPGRARRAAPAACARPRPHPRARHPGCRRARVARAGPQAARRHRVRRHRLRPADQGPAQGRRRARRVPGSARRPDRAVRGRARPGRDRRRRRGRPHGRHGLPAGREEASSTAPPTTARPCSSRPRSTARSTRSCVATSATRSATSSPRTKRPGRSPTHAFWRVEREDRVRVCAEVIKHAGPTIVFCRTKRGTDQLAKKLAHAGIRNEAIHGNRSQGQRERALSAVHARPRRRVDRDRRRGARHPRRRRRVRGALRSAARRQGLHAPLGPHRSRRLPGAPSSRSIGRDQTRDALQVAARARHPRSGSTSRATTRLASLAPGAVQARVDAPPVTRADPSASTPSAPTASRRRAPSSGSTPARASASSTAGREKDLFVHFSAFEPDGGAKPQEGQRVAFEITPGRRGEQASRVRVLAS